MDGTQRQPIASEQAQTAVATEADLTELLANYSNELVSTLDPDGRIVYAGSPYQRILGFAPSTLVGQRLFDLVHEYDRATLQQAWATLDHRQATRLVFRHLHANGTWYWLDARITLAGDHVPSQIVCVANDITERKQIEAEQRTFAALAQNSGDMIAIASLDIELQFLNAAGMQLLGIESLDQLATIPPFDLLDQDARQMVIDYVLPTVVRQGRWIGELRVRNYLSGELIRVAANIFLLTDATSGQPIGYATVSRDIRQQQQAEKRQQLLIDANAALGGSLEHKQALVNFANVAISWFAQWCALVLVEDRRTIRTITVAHVHNEHQDELTELLEQPPGESQEHVSQALRNGQSVLLSNLQTTPTGATAHWQRLCMLSGPSLIIVPLMLNQYQVGTLSVASPPDVQYTQKDLQVAEELARRATIAIENAQLYQDAKLAIGVRDQFLSLASHELKTPLTSILGNLQLLQRRTIRTETLNERDARTLQSVIDQTLRFSRLISGLLDLSRLKGNQFEVERVPFELDTFIEQIVSDMQLTSERHTLIYEQSAYEVRVLADLIRLEQVFQNLIQNAIKYSPNGGTIQIRLWIVGNQVKISVSDSGLGIPPESLPYLFERFYRAPNVQAHNLSGIGIGLFVSREIVRLHGGTVDVESGNDQGSTFTVSLPLYYPPFSLPSEH